MRRRAMPADENKIRKTIAADAVAESGKKNPAALSDSALLDEADKEAEKNENKTIETHKSVSIYVPLIKSNEEEQTITGLVLQPEVTDAQGDIMSAKVIAKAAHTFLAKYNKVTKLGLQHKYFGKYKFELYESWIAPQDVVINGTIIKEGSWIMTVKVLDAKIWDMVKKGELTGFSIGGKAKVQKVEE